MNENVASMSFNKQAMSMLNKRRLFREKKTFLNSIPGL